MLNSLATARVHDPPLIRHLMRLLLSRARLPVILDGEEVGAGLRGSSIDDTRGANSGTNSGVLPPHTHTQLALGAGIDEQSLSMAMHALASLNVGQGEGVGDYVESLVREVRHSE